MCTVTAWATEAGTHLFFNRDEQRTRSEARVPSIKSVDSMPILAPRDPDGGGTWIGVNGNGTIVGLLNYYHAGNFTMAPNQTLRSRGLLVEELLGQPDAKSIATLFRKQALAIYQPFELFAIDPGFEGFHWRWDGQSLIQSELEEPGFWASSSSFRSLEVIESRRGDWNQNTTGGTEFSRQRIHDLHFSLGKDPTAFTTRMSREDARTVSILEIQVRPEASIMNYWALPSADGIDDSNLPSNTKRLARSH